MHPASHRTVDRRWLVAPVHSGSGRHPRVIVPDMAQPAPDPSIASTDLDLGELDLGRARLVETPRGRFALTLLEDGRAVAFEAWCPHLDGPLWEGTRRADEVACPWHAWRYSLLTGECTWAPAGDAEEAAETCLDRFECDAEGPEGRLRIRFDRPL